MEGKLITTYNVHWISLLTVHNTLFLFCHGCSFTVGTEMTGTIALNRNKIKSASMPT
ncbi:hypothetical protein C0J52_23617 [Blattella germanica]|nr:hypothetical protein C0J52_23617 [Blattella germanica]